MSTENDPTPLADSTSEASDRVRELMRASRRDLPTGEELKALEARLAPLIWAPGGGPGNAGPGPGDSGAPTAVGLGAGAKVGALLLAAALGSGGVYVATRTHEPAQTKTTVATRAPSTITKAESTVSEPRAAAPQPVGQPAAQTVAPGAPAPATQAHAAKAASPSEAELLYAARASLESNPRQALKLVEEHRRRFPSGVLTQEREVIAIDALKRLGRADEASQRAERFKERYPDSAHRSKIDGYVPER